MKTAGFTIPYSNEFIPGARLTYQANFPTTYVDGRDIREVQATDILEHVGCDVGELDLFEGSPPCSSFSVAGMHGGKFEDTIGKVKNYSEGVKQRTDDLFTEWLRILLELRPKAILAENVPDLVRAGEPAKFVAGILHQLHEAGYDCHAGIYSSLWVGTATSRKRWILTGVRRDVGQVPRPRLTGSGYTLAEALATMPIESPRDEYMESFLDGTGIWAETGEPMSRYKMADHWETLKPGEQHEDRFTLIRCDPNKPVPTIIASMQSAGAACIMHPYENRRFTPTELKWVSGFPADFQLVGSPRQRWERIGRAVTPPLYEALAGNLAKALGA
jgi:DNA (cytosine-5)-methyltransferase 1